MADEAQEMPESAQNCATEAQLDAILAQLTYDQIRFLIARSEAESDAQACRDIHMSRSTVSHWPEETRELIKQGLAQMGKDGVVTALHIRRRSLSKAMATKRAGLDSPDERVRQGVATEIIEWELGKATQRNEIGLTVEAILGALPPEFREIVREALGAELSGSGVAADSRDTN